MFDGIAAHEARKTELPIAIFLKMKLLIFFFCFFLIYFYLKI